MAGSTSRTAAAFAALVVFGAGCTKPGPRPRSQASDVGPRLRPFIELFLERGPPRVRAERIDLPRDDGAKVQALVARRAGGEFPAAGLVLACGGLPEDFCERTARELAGIGYAVAALPDGNRAEIEAASRYLRTQGVRALGAVAFARAAVAAAAASGESGFSALVLISREKKAPPPAAPAGGLSVLQVPWKRIEPAIFPGGEDRGPDGTGGEAGSAWFEIYEFLAEHVEHEALGHDHEEHDHEEQEAVRYAEVRDLMRALYGPQGLRPRLVELLDAESPSRKAWDLAGSYAAILAEGARILQGRRPHRSAPESWREETQAFRAQVEALLRAVRERDLEAARRSLQGLGRRCGSCHERHRA